MHTNTLVDSWEKVKQLHRQNTQKQISEVLSSSSTHFSTYLPFLREKNMLMRTLHSVCVCVDARVHVRACVFIYVCMPTSVPFQLLNQLTNFHKILYEPYATGGHPNLVLFT